jgi:hypothetical protein
MDGDMESTREWMEYRCSPSASTLTALVRRAGQDTASVLPLLQAFFAESSQWKVAQHLAQVLLRENHILYAEYYAAIALQQSKGEALARLSLATALWERRLPAAVLYLTGILRIQARRIRPRSRRRLLQRSIAELHCVCAAYVRNDAELARWYRSIRHARGAAVNTLNRICVAFPAGDAPPEVTEAALWLAQSGWLPPEKSRAHAIITSHVRRAFLSILRARP